MAVQSVELLLDDGSDAAVRAQWTALADAGLPSQARHTGESNRPHVTLAVAEALTAEQDEALVPVADDVPLPLTLGGLLVLGGRRGVLARLVVPSAALLALQARVAATVGDAVAHTGPGAWTPHVTLAHRLTDDELDRALRVLRPVQEVTGRAVAVRRWDGEAKREWRLG
ncbi:2'-5' RNA ligase family protein [Rhodococcus aerolatus]